MEIQKKSKLQSRYQKMKRKMFEQIYKECQRNFSEKQFQFFSKCIIPQKIKTNKIQVIPSKNENVINSQSYQTNILGIDPNLLTFERKANPLAEQNIRSLKSEQVNRKILTTPNNKKAQFVEFDHFGDFNFFKKLKRKEESKNSSMGKRKNISEHLKSCSHFSSHCKDFSIFGLTSFSMKKSGTRQKMNRMNKMNKTMKQKWFGDRKQRISDSTHTSSEHVPIKFLNRINFANRTSQSLWKNQYSFIRSMR